jgi:hypothetical protein
MLSALLLAVFASAQASAQAVPTTTPTPVPNQSAPPNSRDWDGPRTSDIILFVAFLLGCFLFAYFFYAYTVKRRRRAAQTPWDGAYGPGGYGDAHARAFAQPAGPPSGYAALGTPPAYAQYQYPPPPLYAQAQAESSSRPELARAPSSASTSTLIGYGSHSKDKDARRLSEDDDEVPVLENQPARPQPAHKSSWRGRFARLGDRS